MLLQCFDQDQAPSAECPQKYSLMEILFSTIVSVLDGARSWDEVSFNAELYLDFLQKFLPFENGIPSHDTYNRVFQLIKPEYLETAIKDCAQTILKTLEPEAETINIDGTQMLEGTQTGGVTVPQLSAWCSDCGISFGQLNVSSKSNEITAIPLLLKLLDIKGALLTISAMGTQPDIAQQIHESSAFYLLGLKGNQITPFETAKELCSNYSPISQHESEVEDNCDYAYALSCEVFKVLEREVPMAQLWAGLQRIVKVKVVTTHKVSKKVVEDIRYYLTNDTKRNAEQYLQATRNHLGSEKDCHWQLDVILNESASRKYAGNAAKNLKQILRLCTNSVKTINFTGCFRNASIRNKCRLIVHRQELLSQVLYGVSGAN